MQASILLPQSTLRLPPAQLHTRPQALCPCRNQSSCSGALNAYCTSSLQPEVRIPPRQQVLANAGRGRKKQVPEPEPEEEELSAWSKALDHLPTETDEQEETEVVPDEDEEEFDSEDVQDGADQDSEDASEEPEEQPKASTSGRKKDYITTLNARLPATGYEVEKYDEYLLETDEHQRRLRGQKIPRADWQKMADEAKRKKDIVDAEERARIARELVVKGEHV